MGYTTWFNGEVSIDPPLNEHELSYLNDFAHAAHVARHKGAYYVAGGRGALAVGGQPDPDVIHGNVGCKTHEWVANPYHTPHLKFGDPGYHPPRTQVDLPEPICPPEHNTPAALPGAWCQWVPGADGGVLVWDEGEKFYEPTQWMTYLIENFLRPGAFASTPEGQRLVALAGDERLAHFTFDHVCNGEICAEGEDSDDRWKLIVVENVVNTEQLVGFYPSATNIATIQKAMHRLRETFDGDSNDAEHDAAFSLLEEVDLLLKRIGYTTFADG